MRKTGQMIMTAAAVAAISGFALVGFGCESTSKGESDHPTTQSDHPRGEHADHPEGEHPDHPSGDHPEGDHPSGDHPDHPE